MFPFPRRIVRDQDGAAVLEGAAVFPFLFALSFGVFEFSSVFYQHQVMTAGLRDAARYAARIDHPLTAAQETQIGNLATTGTIDGSGDRRLDWWLPDMIEINVTDVDNPVDEDTGSRTYRGGATVYVVEVATLETFPALGFLEFLGIDGIAMRIAQEERVIGG